MSLLEPSLYLATTKTFRALPATIGEGAVKARFVTTAVTETVVLPVMLLYTALITDDPLLAPDVSAPVSGSTLMMLGLLLFQFEETAVTGTFWILAKLARTLAGWTVTAFMLVAEIVTVCRAPALGTSRSGPAALSIMMSNG